MLLVLAVLALLRVEAVRAAADGDVLAGVGVVAEGAHALLQRLALVLAVLDRQAPRVLAGRVVRAADEAAVASELQTQPAGAAGLAGARVGAVLARRKEVRAEVQIQRGDHVADLEVLGLIDRARELVPEGVQHRPPLGIAAGDVVELLLHRGGEAGIDVVLEEAHQKRGDQPAAVLGDEAPLLQPDILAVLQHRQDRGIGGGPADAQLLHLLHQAGLGEARRRLGEVLLRRHLAQAQRIALRHRRQHAAVVFFGRIVGVLAVQLEEPVERDDRAGGAQRRPLAVGHIDGDLIQFGRLHLRGHRPLPDQFVEPALIGRHEGRDTVGGARDVGRTDRLVRLLRVLDLALVLARRPTAGRCRRNSPRRGRGSR